MKRNAESAAPRSPGPDNEALLLRQKQKLLQAREEDQPLQRGQDLEQPQSQLLWRLAEELKAGWREAPDQRGRGLERLCVACLSGLGGGWAEDRAPDSEGSAPHRAAGPPRARRKHRAAVQQEKGPRKGLAPRQPWCATSRRRAGDQEWQGASRPAGPIPPPPSPPERNKGKRVLSVKTGGGRRPPDPGLSRRTDMGEIRRLEEREKEAAQGGRRQPGKAACLVQGPKHNGLDQSPKGKADDQEQLWPVGANPRRGASPPGKLSDKSRWQRELEFAFEALFNTNRKLKRHLNLHLDPKPGTNRSPSEEQGFLEMQTPRRESQREKDARDAQTDVVPAGEPTSPVALDAHLLPSRTSLEKLLSKLESQEYHRMAKGLMKNERRLWSPGAGTCTGEKTLLSCSPESGQAPPRPDVLAQGPLQPQPQEQAGRVSSMASRQGQEMQTGQRRPEQLDWLEQIQHPKPSLGAADLQTELEDETEQRPARLVHLKPDSPADGETEGGYDCSPVSPSASIVDGDSHSQVIRDLQQQILEQNKLHKQFLEEARKRLQAFQGLC